jgi:hypothetical protein
MVIAGSCTGCLEGRVTDYALSRPRNGRRDLQYGGRQLTAVGSGELADGKVNEFGGCLHELCHLIFIRINIDVADRASPESTQDVRGRNIAQPLMRKDAPDPLRPGSVKNTGHAVVFLYRLLGRICGR